MTTCHSEILRDRKHLAFIRTLPCVTCGNRPSQAAHIRKNGDGGVGVKPSDNRAVPLCPSCHYIQHQIGELRFWFPWSGYEAAIVLAKRLHALSGDEMHALLEIVSFRRKKK